MGLFGIFADVMVVCFFGALVNVIVLEPFRQRRRNEEWYALYKAEQQNPDLPARYDDWLIWRTRNRLVAARRVWKPVTADPADHPFADMKLDDLIGHLYDHHFETWNLLGERNPVPGVWRVSHAEDHGYR